MIQFRVQGEQCIRAAATIGGLTLFMGTPSLKVVIGVSQNDHRAWKRNGPRWRHLLDSVAIVVNCLDHQAGWQSPFLDTKSAIERARQLGINETCFR